MDAKQWRQRTLSSTRGRVLSLLRRDAQTVNDLSRALSLTDNAVRLHLAALERDRLVVQDGVRRGVGKPAFVYRLTSEGESLFPKGYAAVLGAVFALVREWDGPAGLEEFLRAVGRRAGQQAQSGDASLRERVDAAAAVLAELGGLVEVDELDEGYEIRGFSCPLAGVVDAHPESCKLAEELVGGIAGAQVTECCDRGSGTPRCRFHVRAPSAA